MVIYSCAKCQKLFNHKSDFLKHQNRKYKCFQNDDYHENGIKSTFENSVLKMIPNNEKKRLLSDIKPEIRDLSGKIDYHKTLPCQKNEKNEDYHNGNQKPNEVGITSKNCVLPTTIKSKKSPIVVEKATISCKYCDKKVQTKSSLNRHFKICKLKPITISDLPSIESSIKKKIDEQLLTVNNNYSKVINNNTINNTQNIQNIIVMDKINLREFGKEDLDHITDEVMNKVIKYPQAGILNLIREIHFNDTMPQNQNINILNKKEQFIEIFNGKEWKKQDKKTAIQNIITSKKDIMDDYVEEKTEKNLISNFIKDNYENFSEMLDNYIRESLGHYDEQIKTNIAKKCQKLYKEIFNQAELMLFDYLQRGGGNGGQPLQPIAGGSSRTAQ
jgi:DNA-directed RNA polymerase subunit RPC12/RpoP